MASLKNLLNCIGVNTNQNLSVLFHVFGYTEGQVPADPNNSITARESLVDFMKDVQKKHFHVNMITVGIDNFSAAERRKVDYSIYRSRKIFRTVGPTFGRIQRYEITASESNGRNDIGSEDEATALTQEWTVPNNGMDVFLVENISAGFIGISNINGPCDKDAKGRNGVIGGEANLGSETLAKTVAHEIGHYLGLKHTHGSNCPTSTADQDNLMAQSRCASSSGEAGQRAAMNLTTSQGTKMKKHCFVKNGC